MRQRELLVKIARLDSWHFHWDFVKKPFAVENWLEEKLRVYDTDSGGSNASFWVVMNDEGEPTFWRCHHSYHWANYGQEDSYLTNEFEIEVVSREELDANAQKALKFVV